MLHYGTISAHMITSGWYNKVDMSFIPVSLKKKKNKCAPKYSSMYLNSFYHFLNFQRGNESKSLLLKPYAYSITKKKKKNLQNTKYIQDAAS